MRWTLLVALAGPCFGWHNAVARVTGVDISATALAQARARLGAAGLLDQATLIEADLDTWRPDAECYDLITCFYFLDRRLWPTLRTAVRPHGLICLNTYHTGRLVDYPETDPAYLLAPGELATLIKGWNWRLLAAQTDAWMEAVFGQLMVRAGDVTWLQTPIDPCRTPASN